MALAKNKMDLTRGSVLKNLLICFVLLLSKALTQPTAPITLSRTKAILSAIESPEETASTRNPLPISLEYSQREVRFERRTLPRVSSYPALAL